MTEAQEVDRRFQVESEEENDENESSGSVSDRSGLSEASIDDSFQYLEESTREFFEEMPSFSIKCFSPCGRTPSPITNEPISLLNLSISPIGSTHDMSEYTEDDDSRTSNTENFRNSEKSGCMTDTDDEERVSLDDITAQINTPPQNANRGSSKRLNLETIFEGVFLETPPKRRRHDTWHMRAIREVTVERINTYVREQQQNNNDSNEHLCRLFDEHIDLQ